MIIIIQIFYQIIIKQKMSKAQEIIYKLDKLKIQTSEASDFLALEKVSEKINKIKSKLHQFSNNREFRTIIDKIQQLITQKNRYFKQKMLKKLNPLNPDTPHTHPNRTLKHCKSADNLKIISNPKITNTPTPNPTSTMDQTVSQSTRQFYHTNHPHITKLSNKIHQNKTVYIRQYNPTGGDEDQSEFSVNSNIRGSESQSQIRTEKNQKFVLEKERISKQKSSSEHNHHELSTSTTQHNKKPTPTTNDPKKQLKTDGISLQQKLLYSFKQVDDLANRVSALHHSNQKLQEPTQHQSPQSPMTKNYLMKQQQIVDYYKSQLNTKNSIIFNLESQLLTYKSTNSDLKNIIITQQHKNQNYIDDLKTQNKNLKKYLQKYQKENQLLNTSIEDLQNKNQGLLLEVRKLVQKLTEETNEKQQIKKNIINSATLRTQYLQRQINQLSTQSTAFQKLQIKFQQSQQQNQHLSEYQQKLSTRIDQLEQQSKKYANQRDTIQLQVFQMQEQLKQLKNQLKNIQQSRQSIAEQLHETKQKLKEQLMTNNLFEYENQLKNNNKLNKLKEIKGLLTELK